MLMTITGRVDDRRRRQNVYLRTYTLHYLAYACLITELLLTGRSIGGRASNGIGYVRIRYGDLQLGENRSNQCGEGHAQSEILP